MRITNNQAPIIKQLLNCNKQNFKCLNIDYCLEFDVCLLDIRSNYV